MHCSLYDDLLRESDRFLAGAITLPDFSAWLDQAAWAIEHEGDEETLELAASMRRIIDLPDLERVRRELTSLRGRHGQARSTGPGVSGG
jgi:hypothetical protein